MHKPPSRWFRLEGRLHRLDKMKETMPPKWPDVSLFLCIRRISAAEKIPVCLRRDDTAHLVALPVAALRHLD